MVRTRSSRTSATSPLVDVYSADEAFVTGTFGGLTPVHQVDGRYIGGDVPGPLTRRLRELYAQLIERHTDGQPADAHRDGEVPR